MSKWKGICPELKVAIKARLKWICRPPNGADKGGLPKGTTEWPKITDLDVRSTVNKAWRLICEAVADGTATTATMCAHEMTMDAWKGEEDGEDILTGRAAAYVRNNWSHGNGEWNPAQFKAALLAQLNAPAP